MFKAAVTMALGVIVRHCKLIRIPSSAIVLNVPYHCVMLLKLIIRRWECHTFLKLIVNDGYRSQPVTRETSIGPLAARLRPHACTEQGLTNWTRVIGKEVTLL